MRWIFRYTPKAKQYISRLTKTKLPESQPWLHVAVKTVSNRNPWCGVVVYVWDTRQVIYEHRFNGNVLTSDMFTIAKSGMQRAVDNREPLKGGRKDCDEFFEFGTKFDASKGTAFDGAARVVNTDLYKRRNKKRTANESDMAEITSDNTSLAPDVDTVGTGDDQCELGTIVFDYVDKASDCFRIVPSGLRFKLYQQYVKGCIATGDSKEDIIEQYNLQHI